MTDGAARDIEERTIDYAVRAVALSKARRDSGDTAAVILARQFLRSATSVGANVAEAQSAESRADFVHKCAVARKEARESLFWLRVLERSGLMARERLSPLMQETDELHKILTTIILRTKEGTARTQAGDA